MPAAVRCQPYAPAALHPEVLISVRCLVNSRVIVGLEKLGQLKKSGGLIENRTRDIAAYSTVPQPTALLRAPCYSATFDIKFCL
jgi:hypothetical protein